MRSARHPGAPRLLLALLLLAALLRGLWIGFATGVPDGNHDPTRYLLHAIDLAEGRGYVLPWDGRPTAYYPVGYPLALSAALRVAQLLHATPHAPTARLFRDARRVRLAAHEAQLAPFAWAGSLLNLVLGVASVGLVFALARSLLGLRAAALAGLLTAVSPSLILHTSVLLSETLFAFLLLAALWLLLAQPFGDAGPRVARLLGFGALLGAATLVRPVALALLAAPPLALWWGGSGVRRALAATALAALAAALVVAPWSLRNGRVMRAPVLVSTNLGDNLCVGHYPGAPGHFVFTPFCASDRAYGRPLANPEWELRHSARLRRKALVSAWQHLADEPALLARKLYYLMWHDRDGVDGAESFGDRPFLTAPQRAALVVLSDAWYYPVLALALPGLGLLCAGRDPRRLLLVLAVASLLAAPLPFFGSPRFHVPVLPLLALAAGLALARADSAWRLRRASPG